MVDRRIWKVYKAMIFESPDSALFNNSIIYNFSPPSMMKAKRSLLLKILEITKEIIRVEEFAGY